MESNLLSLPPAQGISLNTIGKITKEALKLGFTVTKHENIGGVVYPVNYHSDGMITMDYPELPLFKDKPDGINSK